MTTYGVFYQKSLDFIDANIARLRAMPYPKYLTTVHWYAFRQMALKAADYQCQNCGARYGLEVHHLTYERLGREKLEDVVVLCDACHNDKHNKNAA